MLIKKNIKIINRLKITDFILKSKSFSALLFSGLNSQKRTLNIIKGIFFYKGILNFFSCNS